jgi:CheY-like chemotaxis protein
MGDTIQWQILFVDDDEDTCRQVKEFLEDEPVTGTDGCLHIETCTDFDKALDILDTYRFDLLILDVRLGAHDIPAPQEEMGRKTLAAIQQRRFVPVVFYTGLPHLVRDLETSLIQVVEKTYSLSRLLIAIQSVFDTRLPAVHRALISHLETVQRDYMWEFVAKHWEQFGDTSDRTALAYLLARRLAMSLSGSDVQRLAQEMGGPLATVVAEDHIHPMQYYVMPPVNPLPLTGDIYCGQVGEQVGYWVLLTPSCDLVWGKAEWVLLARCVLLTEQTEYQDWKSNPSTGKKRLESLLKNNRRKQPERSYLLPGALVLPDLVVDFQQLVALQRGRLDSLERIASLDKPFAESLTARFTRYFGRLGTPDLDVQFILSRLSGSVEL